MPNNLIFFFRLLAWTLLVTLESVIGFPWLSLWVSGNWILNFSPKKEIFSLISLTIILAAVYSLPLTIVGVAVILMWQSQQQTTKNNRLSFLVLIVVAIIIGIATGIKFSWLTIGGTILSWLILIKADDLFRLKNLWHKNTLIHLSE